MMKKLSYNLYTNIDQTLAKELHTLWQESYPIEARLIGVNLEDFPPLSKKPEDFELSNNHFLVLQSEKKVLACLEIRKLDRGFRFQSFLVAPEHLRKGLGSKLLLEGINLYKKPIFIETGALNVPAIALYKKYGFQIHGVYRAHGILKVKLKKS